MSTPRQFYRNIYFLSTGDSLNSTTASVIVTGGLSIQKNTNILGNLTVSNVTSTGLTTGNINFTGNLYQNNVPYIGSQWTGTSGSLYYGTGGSFVGINTTSPSFALDVNGNARTLGLTTGNINFTGNLYQNGSPYIGSQWTGSTGTLLYYGSGGAMIGINTSTPSYTLDVNGNVRTLGFTTGNITSTGLTTGNITSTGLTTGNIQSTGLTTGNINFTGNLYQNSIPYIGSQWIGTSGTLYYGSGGNTLVGINTTNPSFTLDVNGNARTLGFTTGSIQSTGLTTGNVNSGNITSTGLTTGSIQSTGLTTGNVNSGNITSTGLTTGNVNSGNITSTGLTTGNINFTGNLFQNSIPYIGSQWTGSSGTLYYGSGGSTLVGINTTNPTSTLTVAGDLFVSGNTTLSNFMLSNFSSSSLITNVVNVASTSYIYGGVATIGNNVITATNVNGLIFPTATTRSFTVKLSTSTICSVNPNYFYQSTIEGVLTDSGWVIETNFVGNTPNVTFSISSTGQLMYTSTNVTNWTSTTVRYQATGYYLNGSSLPPSITTSGNFSINSLSVTSTTDTINTSTGSAIISGGLGVVKSLNIGGSLNVNSNTNTIGNLFTTGGNVGINTTNPIFILDVNGNARTLGFTTGSIQSTGLTTGNINSGNITSTGLTTGSIQSTGLTTGNINSGNITSTGLTTGSIQSIGLTTGSIQSTGLTTGNINSGNITSTGLTTGNINSGNITSTGLTTGNINSGNITSTGLTTGSIQSTGLTTGSIQSTGLTTGNIQSVGLVSTTSTIPNIIHTNITTTSLLVTGGGLIGTFNSNTIGNIFTTGGNVGINTNTPVYTLDVNGNARTLGLTTGNIQSTGLTTGSIQSTGLTTGSIQSTGLTTGSIQSTGLTTGNIQSVGLVSTTSTIPNIIHTNITTTSLLVTGGGLIGTFNSNTIGNLFTTGGNVGINTNTPVYTLDVNGSSRFGNFSSSGNNMYFSGTNQYLTWGGGSDYLRIGALNRTTALSVNFSGQIGINTTNQSTDLDVSGNIRCNYNNFAGITLQGSSSDININIKNTAAGGTNFLIGCGATGSGSPGNFYIFDNVSNNFRLSINSAGNVGINTTSPANTLDVNGTSRIAGALNLNSGFTVNSNTASSVLNFSPLYIGSDTNHYIRFANATNFNFANLGLDGPVVAGYSNVCLGTTGLGGQKAALIVNNSQQVGIGGISPGYVLDVLAPNSVRFSGTVGNLTTSSNGLLQIISGTATSSSQDGAAFRASNDSNSIINFLNSANVFRGNIYGANSSSVAYATSSDVRLKTNIKPLNTKAIDIIKKLNPVEFDWIAEDENSRTRHDYGFIAQETFKILPHLRKEIHNYSDCECENHLNLCDNIDHEYPTDTAGNALYYGLDYGKFTPYLTGAVKELIDQNEKLINFINNKFPNELIL